MLGVLVFSTFAQEPTESAFTEGFVPSSIVTTKTLTFSKGRVAISSPMTETEALSVNGYTVNYSYVAFKFTYNIHGDTTYYISAPIPIKSCFDILSTKYDDDGVILEFPIFNDSGDTVNTVYYDRLAERWYTYLPEIIGSDPSFWEYIVYETGGNADEAYQSGYNQGYFEGEEDGYTQGYTNGVNTGYQNGLTDGYDNGYSDGYDTASSEIENQNALGLFGRGILDGILDIYFDTFRIPIFGTSLGEIIGYFIFFLWVLLIVKIVAFVI